MKRPRLNIGILCHSTCGGSSRVALESGCELSRNGNEVHFFMRTPPYFSYDSEYSPLIHTVYGNRPVDESPSLLKKEWTPEEYEIFINLVLSVIQQSGLDILHIHYALPFAFIAVKIREKLGDKAPPMVVTLHGTDVLGLSEESGRREALSRDLVNFDALTTVSRSHADLLMGLSDSKQIIEVIPNFVDLSRFFPREHPPDIIRPSFMHISNFRSHKDVGGTIAIFANVLEKMDAELLLVGDGEEMDRVKELVADKKISEKVHFLGLRPDVALVLPKADFLIVSSKYESFCLVALEAMACGVPVIAPNVGGLPEVVHHKESGFLFAPGDYRAGAEYAAQLLSEPKQYKKISIQAAHQAKTFDQRLIVKQYEKLYRRMIA